MSVRFVADENLERAILSGLLRRRPNLDIVRVQDVGLLHADDPVILDWAEILLIDDCSLEGEWEGQVRYLPL